MALHNWNDYEKDLDARDRVREFAHGCIVFFALLVIASLFGCTDRDGTYEPTLQNVGALRPMPQAHVTLSAPTGNFGCNQVHVQFFASTNGGPELSLVDGLPNSVRLRRIPNTCTNPGALFSFTAVWQPEQSRYQCDAYIPTENANNGLQIPFSVGEQVAVKIQFVYWDNGSQVTVVRDCSIIDTVPDCQGGGGGSGGGFEEQSEDSTLSARKVLDPYRFEPEFAEDWISSFWWTYGIK
ncbi:MAG: hypothetical protein ACREJC_09695 [Tepidisphaeraceae bacterium]